MFDRTARKRDSIIHHSGIFFPPGAHILMRVQKTARSPTSTRAIRHRSTTWLNRCSSNPSPTKFPHSSFEDQISRSPIHSDPTKFKPISNRLVRLRRVCNIGAFGRKRHLCNRQIRPTVMMKLHTIKVMKIGAFVTGRTQHIPATVKYIVNRKSMCRILILR